MERLSEATANLEFVHTKSTLEQAGDNIVLHSQSVSAKNSISRFLSRSKDNSKLNSLSARLERSVKYFEDAVATVEAYDKVKDLTLTQFRKPSGYGVQWHMDEIKGLYLGKALEIFYLESTDWSDKGNFMHRVVRWTDSRGRIDGAILTDIESKKIHDAVIRILADRNKADKIGENSFPNGHREYMENAYNHTVGRIGLHV